MAQYQKHEGEINRFALWMGYKSIKTETDNPFKIQSVETWDKLYELP